MNTLGLRERKKAQTLRKMQEEALRLFAEQGYEATTIEQIAEASGVSPSTFYRYFPTKEDVVVQDEYDPMIIAVVGEHLRATEPIQALRDALGEMIPAVQASDGGRILSRIKLIMSVPALRAKQFEQSRVTERMIADLVAERVGRAADELEVRNFAAAITAAMTTAVLAWADGDGRDDLAEAFDRCIAHLGAGVPL